MFSINKMPQSIDIGYTGETGFRKLEIDMTPWLEMEPDGIPSIVAIRPGETQEDAYIAATSLEDGILTWEITAGDVGTQAGEGIIQIWLEKTENDSIVKRGKSVMIRTRIHYAINDASAEVPEAQEAWLEQMTALKTQTVEAAEQAMSRGMPEGGYTGDLLAKSSDNDYATEWITPASAAEQDNTRPITAAAVYTEIGNINALLEII